MIPNWWCISTYVIAALNKESKEGKAALKDINKSLKEHFSVFPKNIDEILDEYNEFCKHDTMTIKDLWDGSPRWLGNFFLHEGMKLKDVLHYNCRGEILNLEENSSDDMISFDVESSWAPMPNFLQSYYDKYSGILKFEYLTQEPGNVIYEASSKEFADKCLEYLYGSINEYQVQDINKAKKYMKIYSFKEHLNKY